MSSWLTEQDLNAIKGLLYYLNHNMSSADLAADVSLIDSNGETVGRIEMQDGAYVFSST
jgi:hypothetical protein